MKNKLCLIVMALMFLSFAVDALAARLVDNGDGTVTDNTTGLIWQQGEGGQITWEVALTYCEALSLAGKNDWRLPNIKVIDSLIDDSQYDPAIDKDYFPNASIFNYWSSTTYAAITANAWYASFYSGGINQIGKTASRYVRCVRGGQ